MKRLGNANSFDLHAVLPTGTILPYGGDTAPDGFLLCDGSPILRSTYAALFSVFRTKYGVGDSSTTFNLPDCRGTFLRGVSTGTSLDPDRSIRVASVGGTFNLAGSVTTIGSSTVQVTSTENLAPGMQVTGMNIPANAHVGEILDATSFNLRDANNANYLLATNSGSGITLSISNAAAGNYTGSTQSDQFRSHTHSAFATAVAQGPTAATPWSFLGGGSTGATGGNETRPVNLYVNYIVKY